MSSKRYAVILAGGRGERFWPYSTEERPKQLLALVGGQSLLEQTVRRLEDVVPPDRVFIITSATIAEKVRAALPDVPAAHVVAEPCGRNTAAAVATAGGLVRGFDPQGVFSILPSDHVIGDVPRFRHALNACYAAAEQHDVLITIGIRPTQPSTGYGYIETAEPAFEVGGDVFLRAARFVEKPDAERARRYVEAGNFCWNAGMFVWSVPALEKALGRYRPDMAAWMREVSAAMQKPGHLERVLSHRYAGLENISIDYALMEKADNIVTLAGDFGWDDVGTWDSLGAHLPLDGAGNAVLGNAMALDARGNVVVSENHITALVGVENLIVVHAEGATLVCRKDQAERVKQVVDMIRREGRWKHTL